MKGIYLILILSFVSCTGKVVEGCFLQQFKNRVLTFKQSKKVMKKSKFTESQITKHKFVYYEYKHFIKYIF